MHARHACTCNCMHACHDVRSHNLTLHDGSGMHAGGDLTLVYTQRDATRFFEILRTRRPGNPRAASRDSRSASRDPRSASWASCHAWRRRGILDRRHAGFSIGVADRESRDADRESHHADRESRDAAATPHDADRESRNADRESHDADREPTSQWSVRMISARGSVTGHADRAERRDLDLAHAAAAQRRMRQRRLRPPCLH